MSFFFEKKLDNATKIAHLCNVLHKNTHFAQCTKTMKYTTCYRNIDWSVK